LGLSFFGLLIGEQRFIPKGEERLVGKFPMDQMRPHSKREFRSTACHENSVWRRIEVQLQLVRVRGTEGERTGSKEEGVSALGRLERLFLGGRKLFLEV